jgi:hypothetical protein
MQSDKQTLIKAKNVLSRAGYLGLTHREVAEIQEYIELLEDRIRVEHIMVPLCPHVSKSYAEAHQQDLFDMGGAS